MEELEQIHPKVYKSDIEFLRTIDDNQSNAIRTVIKEYRTNYFRGQLFQFLQFLLFGVILLGISAILPINDLRSWFISIIGLIIFLFGFINIIYILMRNRRRNSV